MNAKTKITITSMLLKKRYISTMYSSLRVKVSMMLPAKVRRTTPNEDKTSFRVSTI